MEERDDSSVRVGSERPGDLDITEVPIESASERTDEEVRILSEEGATQPGESMKSTLWSREFLVITFINFLLFCGFQVFPSSLPMYMRELGAPDSMLGLVTGLTTIAALAIRPFSGAILDRFGRKGIFLFSLAMMVGVSLSFAFFPIVGIILLIRFIHGIGWGISTTAASTIATDTIPLKRFGEGIGFYSLSTSLALAIAPGLGIALFQSVGMQTVSFLATGVLACALLLAISMQTRPVAKPVPEEEEKLNLIERTSLFPSIVIFFVTAAYGGVVTFVGVFGESQNVEGIGLFFTVYAVALLISRPLYGRIVDSKGANMLIVPGFILLVGALVLLSLSDSLGMFVLSAAIYGTSFSALQSSLQTLAIASAPPERRGAANATFLTGFDAGIGFGAIVSGVVVSAVGYSSMFLLFALLPIIGMTIFMGKRIKRL